MGERGLLLRTLQEGLEEKGEEAQVNTLIYSMDNEADAYDILRSFFLSIEEQKSYATLKAKFDSHFTKRRNNIFERARFNMRGQEEGEPVDTFITALHSLAEHCGYRALHDEMIRDRIVVGIRNAQLAEKLQLDSDLTLETAYHLCSDGLESITIEYVGYLCGGSSR